MKNITNKKLNQLTVIAAALPKFQLKNPDDTKMFHKAEKIFAGKDLTKEYRKKLGDEYFPDKNYIIKYLEPSLVNHKQNLIEAYEKHGDIGVHDYVRSAQKFDKENKVVPVAIGKFQKLKSQFRNWLLNFKLNKL